MSVSDRDSADWPNAWTVEPQCDSRRVTDEEFAAGWAPNLESDCVDDALGLGEEVLDTDTK